MPANQRLKCKIHAINLISFEIGATRGALCSAFRERHPPLQDSFPSGSPAPSVPGWVLQPRLPQEGAGQITPPVPQNRSCAVNRSCPLPSSEAISREHRRCLIHYLLLLLFIIKAPTSFSWAPCWRKCSINRSLSPVPKPG